MKYNLSMINIVFNFVQSKTKLGGNISAHATLKNMNNRKKKCNRPSKGLFFIQHEVHWGTGVFRHVFEC